MEPFKAESLSTKSAMSNAENIDVDVDRVKDSGVAIDMESLKPGYLYIIPNLPKSKWSELLAMQQLKNEKKTVVVYIPMFKIKLEDKMSPDNLKYKQLWASPRLFCKNNADNDPIEDTIVEELYMCANNDERIQKLSGSMFITNPTPIEVQMPKFDKGKLLDERKVIKHYQIGKWMKSGDYGKYAKIFELFKLTDAE